MDDDSGAQQGQDQGSGGSDGGQDPGFTICIKVDGSGKISVGSYPNSDDDGDADDDSTDYKPAPNIKEALTEALAIYRNEGQASDEDGDMAAGYKSKQAETDNGMSTYGGAGSEE